MSSKTEGKKPGPGWFGSLATRMTLWYALSAFALILTASGYLYTALARSLEHKDDVQLSQKLQIMAAYMKKNPGDQEDLRKFVGVLPFWYRNQAFWTRVLDGGKVLTETPAMSQSLPVTLFQGASPGNPSLTVHSLEGGAYRVLVAQVPWEGFIHPAVTVQMALDAGPDEVLLAKFRKKLLRVVGFSFLACALGGYWIAQRGIRPVRKMGETAARIGSSTLYERLDRSGLPSELSELASTFNDMLDRLEESFARLSRFSSDIAHELRTPLQNLRGGAEVILSKDRQPAEYKDLLGSFLEEYQRLSTLIDRLLFLARADQPQTQIQREEVDLKRELGLLQDFYGLSAGESGIMVKVDAPEGLSANLDRSLFQRAVGNLVENSLKHTPAGGSILLRSYNGDGNVHVEVCDTGKGIPQDQVSKVFDRFYRVDPSRTPSSGGAGLGLSIVKSIMSLHAGTVEIKSQEERGTTVLLSFPVVLSGPG
jgi:two-component system, OmpR family, heavy metal sensor histidine kinase CusS